MNADAPTTEPMGQSTREAWAPPTYEVYAVKYAEATPSRAHVFLGGGGDDHDRPQQLDFFVWAIIGPSCDGPDDRSETPNDSTGARTVWVVDTGFGQLDAERRGRRLVRSVTEALATVGVDAGQVADVILTHLHYDHVGGASEFPSARFHLQDAEMAYATGRFMRHEPLRRAFTGEHVADMVRHVYDDRVEFYDGDAEVAPGLSVHLIGGHTLGLQAVRVHTEAGWVVLASDAAHFYENLHDVQPFSIVHDVGAMIEGYSRLRQLADSDDLIVPGHDPLVFGRYPPAGEGLDGVAVRLHCRPT